MARSSFLIAGLAGVAAAASPVPGFRPPAVPLFVQSPLINVWSAHDNLYDGPTTQWAGADLDFFAAVRVDGAPYLLMGNPQPSWNKGTLQTATQTSVTVWSTQTLYTFSAGPVALNMTFTSPLIMSNDWDLLSRPAHYVTFSAAATDGNSYNVELYFDINGNVVVRDPSTLMSWSRLDVTGNGVPAGSATALRIGATVQTPLADTNDRPSWGIAYLIANTTPGSGASVVLQYGNATRSQFWGTGSIPASDNTAQPSPLLPITGVIPPTGPQDNVDRPGDDMPGSPFALPQADPNLCWAACNTTAGCRTWAYGKPNCGGDPAQAQCWLKGDWLNNPGSNGCRVSGVQAQPQYAGTPIVAAAVHALTVSGPAPTVRVLTFAVDEVLTLDWFGEPCPPYWRRNMGVNDSATVPMDMLSTAVSAYPSVKTLADDFDATAAAMLSGVGGDQYATLAQLLHRQVVGGAQLVWVPSKSTVWWLLKEISSCGCLNTADVIYPAFPLYQYYQPELMKRMIIPHLEYAMNFTNQPYPLPWAPHHLGHWPLADLPYTQQENMPLEETAYFLLNIATIAQQQGGDLTWLTPYWPAIQAWIDFLITLLPFPGTQLSTDDFDGQLYNATNLALKGVAAIAAYGYIAEKYTGDPAAATKYYTIAADYAATMVEFSWVENGTDSHFMIGYKGSQGDGGDPGSWPMLYNALWLRLLGYTDLLPQQSTYFSQMEAWYMANKLQEFGLPLNSRKLYTKDDWMTFLAATFFDSNAKPSPFSATLFDRFFNFANSTTSREPLSDWTNTDKPTAVGFSNRPVYGAIYAPVLVAQAAQLGLGVQSDPAVAHANEAFRAAHARRAAGQTQ